MHTVNLGILAHVDAGKTSLTERLLYAGGVIDEMGSVDDGSTQTDTLALERRRGITIRSAVVSFLVDDVTVNLIDTPGHPDFIAEVERVLGTLDGAVLVVSAVEGVQSQTRVLMRTLRRLQIPTLIFVNKLDRAGADPDRVLREITERLSSSVVQMGRTSDPGSRAATFTAYDGSEPATTTRLADVLADHDDTVLAAFVDDATGLSYGGLHDQLVGQTRAATVHPVYFGSAVTGAGVAALTTGITDILPAAPSLVDGPVSGTVFKIERGPGGEKVAYVRLFSGTVRVRDRVRVVGDKERKVTAINVFEHGSAVSATSVRAGQIATLRGLGDIRVGEAIGTPRSTARGHHFAPPTLETVVTACRPADTAALHVALTQLAEQDPLINLRDDVARRETYVSLYGEVQKEVIGDTLASDYGIDVRFQESTTICIERPVGAGEAVERRPSQRSADHPFLAGLGLRVGPAAIGTGLELRLGIERGSLPKSFLTAIEESVPGALQQGLHGWQVTDCVVTIISSGYFPRQSQPHAVFDRAVSTIADDFRNLSPLVLMSALRQARTVVCEPIHRFRLEVPSDTLGLVLSSLASVQAMPDEPVATGAAYLLEGEIPAARIHTLQSRLPGLTRGEGVLETAFDSYQPTRGTTPARPRTDHNPLNRKEYLLHVARRV